MSLKEKIQTKFAKYKAFFVKSHFLKAAIISGVFLSSGAIITGTVYSVSQNVKLGGDYIPGYLGRIELNPYFDQSQDKDTTANNASLQSISVNGKTLNFSNQNDLTFALSQATNAINSYNRSLGYRNFFVNYGIFDSFTEANNITRNDNKMATLFYNAEAFDDIANLNPNTSEEKPNIQFNKNNAWFNFANLNQLTIDRYGFEWTNEGSNTTSNTPTLTTLVNWSDLGYNTLKTLSGNQLIGTNPISFNIFNRDIDKKWFDPLLNSDNSKYVIPTNFNNRATNNWDIWLDKDLLALKINYVMQTYIFNQQEVLTSSSITSIIGNPNISNGQTKKQKEKYDIIQNNFYALSDSEKKFASDYIKIIFNGNRDTNSNSLSYYTDAINTFTNSDRFIQAKDVNEIYNQLSSNNGDLNIFNGFLLNRITPGPSGNWTSFFPKYNSSLNNDFIEKINDEIKTVPIRHIGNNQLISSKDNDGKITNYSFDENVINITVDNNLTSNISNQQLFDRLKNYSVQYLTYRQKILTKNNNGIINSTIIWPTGVYSDDTLSTSLEAIDLIDAPSFFSTPNEQGNLKEWELYAIVAAVFLTLVGIVVSILYRYPGIIAFFAWLAAQSAGLATFFGLNLSLSSDATIGLITGLITSLLIMLYSLDIFKQEIKNGSSIRNAASQTLKRSLLFCFDVSIICFILGIMFAFVADTELRGFGLTLSISSFMMLLIFVALGLLGNWIFAYNYYYKHLYFLSRKYSLYLRIITGEIQATNSFLTNKLLSENYKNKIQQFENNRFWFNLFSWKTWIYFVLCLVIFILGIILIFIPSIGFGSSFILKEGFLIEYVVNENTITTSPVTDDSISKAISALNLNSLESLLNINLSQNFVNGQTDTFFFRTTSAFDQTALNQLFLTYLHPGTFSIQTATSLSSNSLFQNGFEILAYSLIIVFFYFLFRFGWLQSITTIALSLLNLGITIALITIFRLDVDNNLMYLILLGATLGFCISVWVQSNLKQIWHKKRYYNALELKGMTHKMLSDYWKIWLLFFAVILVIAILGASSNFLRVFNIYIYLIINVIATIFFLIPALHFTWVYVVYLLQSIFYRKISTEKDDDRLTIKYKIRSYDPIDEQLITGINHFE